MESSHSTTRHIKVVARGIKELNSHQARASRNNFPTSIDQRVRPPFKKFDPNQAHKWRNRCSKCGDSKHVEGFKCPARKFQFKTCNKYGHFTSLGLQKKSSFMSRKSQGTSVASRSSVCTRRFHMWPVKWSDLQWWIFLFTSENTIHTSWYQVSHTISSYY